MSLSPALRAIFPPTTEMRGTGGLRGRCLGFAYGWHPAANWTDFICDLSTFRNTRMAIAFSDG
jgi:hypothetical protein